MFATGVKIFKPFIKTGLKKQQIYLHTPNVYISEYMCINK